MLDNTCFDGSSSAGWRMPEAVLSAALPRHDAQAAGVQLGQGFAPVCSAADDDAA